MSFCKYVHILNLLQDDILYVPWASKTIETMGDAVENSCWSAARCPKQWNDPVIHVRESLKSQCLSPFVSKQQQQTHQTHHHSRSNVQRCAPRKKHQRWQCRSSENRESGSPARTEGESKKARCCLRFKNNKLIEITI